MTDTLGDRLKQLEQAEAARRAMKGLPLMARLDGRSFHTWTRGLRRPYDDALSSLMIKTTKHLVEQTHATVGYTQSDEISLCWYVEADSASEYLFDGKYQKLTSVLASIATAYFNVEGLKHFSPPRSLATFDCRVWSVPDLRTAYLNFLWRELDATKNAISMAASTYYSPKQLHGKTSSERQELLFQKGVNFNDYPAFFKRGSYVQRVDVWKELTDAELAQIPPKFWPKGLVMRSEVIELDLPPLLQVTNPVEVLFAKQPPVTKKDEPTG